MKKLFALLLASIIIISLSGCDDHLKYKGNNPELQVVATNSLLGISGHETNQIIIFEKDEFGRVMFSFFNGANSGDEDVLAILIAQKTTNQDAYYYDNKNFILCGVKTNQTVDKDFVLQHFSNQQLETLKKENDWNKEINEQKLFKVKITRKKSDNISTQRQRKVFESVSPDFHSGYSITLTTDKNGNTIYYMRGMHYDEKTGDYIPKKSYLIMFDADKRVNKTTGIAEIHDLWNYQQELENFKEANDWSFYS